MLTRHIDERHLEYPFGDSRMLRREGYRIGCKDVAGLSFCPNKRDHFCNYNNSLVPFCLVLIG